MHRNYLAQPLPRGERTGGCNSARNLPRRAQACHLESFLWKVCVFWNRAYIGPFTLCVGTWKEWASALPRGLPPLMVEHTLHICMRQLYFIWIIFISQLSGQLSREQNYQLSTLKQSGDPVPSFQITKMAISNNERRKQIYLLVVKVIIAHC